MKILVVLALLRVMLADNDGLGLAIDWATGEVKRGALPGAGGAARAAASGAERAGELIGNVLTGGLVAGGGALVVGGVKDALTDDEDE